MTKISTIALERAIAGVVRGILSATICWLLINCPRQCDPFLLLCALRNFLIRGFNECQRRGGAATSTGSTLPPEAPRRAEEHLQHRREQLPLAVEHPAQERQAKPT